MKDCIIVGGGPAGLTAALYLARFLRSVTVFDAAEGRARMIPQTNNLSPFPGGISGRDLLARMQSHAERYGAEIVAGTVDGIERQGGAFNVRAGPRVETARSLILATGVFNHRPPLSREDHERGVAAGLIRYCPVCDGFEVRDKRIAVLGGGTHGFDEARFIRGYSASVTLIPADGTVASSGSGIEALPSPMQGLALSDRQVIVTQENGRTQLFDTLYAALGTSARTGLAADLGVLLTDGGCIAVDAKQRTSIAGVYAIGDVTHGLDQIAVAMGQGAVAATGLHNDLSC